MRISDWSSDVCSSDLSFIQAAAATAASVIVPSTWAQPAPRFAASPVALGVIDVAGNLALTQKIFDNYAVAHKDRVSRFAIHRSPAPELAGKIRAMQEIGRAPRRERVCQYV